MSDVVLSLAEKYVAQERSLVASDFLHEVAGKISNQEFFDTAIAEKHLLMQPISQSHLNEVFSSFPDFDIKTKVEKRMRELRMNAPLSCAVKDFSAHSWEGANLVGWAHERRRFVPITKPNAKYINLEYLMLLLILMYQNGLAVTTKLFDRLRKIIGTSTLKFAGGSIPQLIKKPTGVYFVERSVLSGITFELKDFSCDIPFILSIGSAGGGVIYHSVPFTPLMIQYKMGVNTDSLSEQEKSFSSLLGASYE